MFILGFNCELQDHLLLEVFSVSKGEGSEGSIWDLKSKAFPEQGEFGCALQVLLGFCLPESQMAASIPSGIVFSPRTAGLFSPRTAGLFFGVARVLVGISTRGETNDHSKDKVRTLKNEKREMQRLQRFRSSNKEWLLCSPIIFRWFHDRCLTAGSDVLVLAFKA